jgi:hypothetical protein
MFISRFRAPGQGRGRRMKFVCVKRIDHFLKEGQVEKINPRLANEVKALNAKELARRTGTERIHIANFDQEAALQPTYGRMDPYGRKHMKTIHLLGKATRVPYSRLLARR